jgi:histone H1/5
MSDAVQVKQVKKAAAVIKPKATASHPTFREMILEAIKKQAERSGSSRQAIVKYVMANFGIDEKAANQHTRVALKAGVKQGWLKQAKGVGASGSFRVGEVAKPAAAPKPKAVAKPKAVKVSNTPKKNVKKIVKPKAPKPIAAAAAPAAPATVTKPASPVKKVAASPTKKVVKKAAPAKPAAEKKAAPAKAAAAPAKKAVAAKKQAAKKTVTKA